MKTREELQEETTKLREQLEEARREKTHLLNVISANDERNKEIKAELPSLREDIEGLMSERDHYREGLLKIAAEDNPPTGAACRSFANEYLAPEPNPVEGVCEECGGSGEVWYDTGAVAGDQNIMDRADCPKGCQPQPPGDVIIPRTPDDRPNPGDAGKEGGDNGE